MKKKQLYKDSKGVIYQIGDIVLNPCIMDYWVVQKCTKKDKEQYGLTTDICLALNNDKDDFVIDIDEPAGFEIIVRCNDDNYKEAIDGLNHIAEMRKKLYEGKDESI